MKPPVEPFPAVAMQVAPCMWCRNAYTEDRLVRVAGTEGTGRVCIACLEDARERARA